MQNATRIRSFLPKTILITALGLVTALGSYKAAAVDVVVTDPVGFITLNAQGTSGASGKSWLGLGMTQIPTNLGIVTAKAITVSGTQTGTMITVSSALPSGGFNQIAAGPQYFIAITTNGVMDDVVSNSTTAVFTAENISSLVSSGNTYKIFPHWTLAKTFGPANEAGLKAGTSSTADLINVLNPLTQAFASYYYATSSKTISAGWKQDGQGNVDKAQVPLYLDQGLYIKKQTTTNVTVKLVGAVKLGPTWIPIFPLNNAVGNVYASSNMTLGTSGLYIPPGNQSNSVVAGTAATADLVNIHDAISGSFATYYYATSSKTISAGWKQDGAGNTDKTNVQIPIGGNMYIKIKSPRSGFDWKPAAPYTP